MCFVKSCVTRRKLVNTEGGFRQQGTHLAMAGRVLGKEALLGLSCREEGASPHAWQPGCQGLEADMSVSLGTLLYLVEFSFPPL